jgi:hypothetical protein
MVRTLPTKTTEAATRHLAYKNKWVGVAIFMIIVGGE